MSKEISGTVRSGNFELLRIFAMLLIVANHFAFMPNIPFNALRGMSNEAIVNIIATQSLVIGGKLGVFLFGAITGYFLIVKSPRLSSLLRIVSLTVFYSVAFYLGALWFDRAKLEVPEVIFNFFPLTFYRYWFITAYVLLFLSAPFINMMLRPLLRKQFLYLLVVFGVLWYVIPTVCKINPYNTWKFYENEFLTLVYAYGVGAYIRLFYEHTKVKSIKLWGIVVMSLIIEILYLIVSELHALHTEPKDLKLFWPYITEFNSVFTLLLGISIFMLFKQIPSFESQLINRIAACMLGVYLLHCNQYLTVWLFREFLTPLPHILNDSVLSYLTYSALCIAGVSGGCIAIELLRWFIALPLSGMVFGQMGGWDKAYREFLPVPGEQPERAQAEAQDVGGSLAQEAYDLARQCQTEVEALGNLKKRMSALEDTVKAMQQASHA